MSHIGILHPGEMGVSIAASAMNSGHQVYWLSQERSDQTRARAERQQLTEITSLREFCETCDIILGVCPPHAAEEVARSVMEAGFEGLYLDANAISPERAVRIKDMLELNQIKVVDGGIIGGPAWQPKETYLYLSGEAAAEIANSFPNGPLETRIIGSEVGQASALKMCYAAYSKGTTALLAIILAAADSLRVRDELYRQWDRDESGFAEQVNQRVRRVTAKAWRFEGEMEEIAATFRATRLPDGFHLAAAETYHRLSRFKNAQEIPSLEDIFQALLP